MQISGIPAVNSMCVCWAASAAAQGDREQVPISVLALNRLNGTAAPSIRKTDKAYRIVTHCIHRTLCWLAGLAGLAGSTVPPVRAPGTTPRDDGLCSEPFVPSLTTLPLNSIQTPAFA